MKKIPQNKKLVKEAREKAREYVAEALIKRLQCATLLCPYMEPGNIRYMYASISVKDILKLVKFSDKSY